MSDTYRPGGVVSTEVVMVLDRHYRVAMQEMTAWGTASGFAMYHDLGVVTLATAQATCDGHRGEIRGRMVIWLEWAKLGTEAFTRVPDAK